MSSKTRINLYSEPSNGHNVTVFKTGEENVFRDVSLARGKGPDLKSAAAAALRQMEERLEHTRAELVAAGLVEDWAPRERVKRILHQMGCYEALGGSRIREIVDAVRGTSSVPDMSKPDPLDEAEFAREHARMKLCLEMGAHNITIQGSPITDRTLLDVLVNTVLDTTGG